jgi:hypothetical protein
MADRFANIADKTNPADVHFAITPSDSVALAFIPRAIYCATGGTAQVVDAAGTVLPYVMNAGDILPFRGVRINATSTTGTYYGWM